jgi:hypothetical protein
MCDASPSEFVIANAGDQGRPITLHSLLRIATLRSHKLSIFYASSYKITRETVCLAKLPLVPCSGYQGREYITLTREGYHRRTCTNYLRRRPNNSAPISWPASLPLYLLMLKYPPFHFIISYLLCFPVPFRSLLRLDPLPEARIPVMPVSPLASSHHIYQSLCIPIVICVDQSYLIIFFREYLVICIRYLGQDTFKHSFSHRIQLCGLVFVVVLAIPHVRMRVRPRLAEAGDVNVQAVAHVDPSRIDDIHSVSFGTLHYPRVDIEEVLAPHLAV